MNEVSRSNNTQQDPKTIAIIAHITVIGWIVALVMNNNNKSEFASYYIRQMLGLMLMAVALQIAVSISAFIFPFFGILGLVQLGVLVLWILSLIGAINEQKSETPLVGHLFQDWFKSL